MHLQWLVLDQMVGGDVIVNVAGFKLVLMIVVVIVVLVLVVASLAVNVDLMSMIADHLLIKPMLVQSILAHLSQSVDMKIKS